jgi:hypothetical protein
MWRIIGVDVGIRNLSFCLLEVPAGIATPSVCALERAEGLLALRGKLGWEHVSLCPRAANANHCSHSALLEGLAAYVRSRSDLFEWATHVVIEAQPAARMKMIAAGLFASVRLVNPETKICFQSARRKLAWGGRLGEYGSISTYRCRKQTAVALLEDLVGHSRTLKELGSKKDDAADSFLHALRFAVDLTACPRRSQSR